MPVDPNTLDATIAAIEQRYGRSALALANDAPSIRRIPTGSLELDYATGGGIPIGRFSRFYGGFSSGKTLACWNVIRSAQQMGMTCAYYNAEKQFDPALVERVGVDLSKLIVVEGSIIEEVGVKFEALLGSVHLHVIDSLSTCISLQELNGNVEDQQMAASARAWGRVLRRSLSSFDDQENTCIMVDQVRATFGAPGAAPKPPGGSMIDFTSSLNLYFKRGSWLYRKSDGLLTSDSVKNTTLSGAAEADGIETQIRVEKSRVGQPFRTARIRIDFETMEYDELFELVKCAKFFKVVDGKGSWFTLPDGSKVQGDTQLAGAIRANEDLKETIIEAVGANW